MFDTCLGPRVGNSRARTSTTYQGLAQFKVEHNGGLYMISGSVLERTTFCCARAGTRRARARDIRASESGIVGGKRWGQRVVTRRSVPVPVLFPHCKACCTDVLSFSRQAHPCDVTSLSHITKCCFSPTLSSSPQRTVHSFSLSLLTTPVPKMLARSGFVYRRQNGPHHRIARAAPSPNDGGGDNSDNSDNPLSTPSDCALVRFDMSCPHLSFHSQNTEPHLSALTRRAIIQGDAVLGNALLLCHALRHFSFSHFLCCSCFLFRFRVVFGFVFELDTLFGFGLGLCFFLRDLCCCFRCVDFRACIRKPSFYSEIIRRVSAQSSLELLPTLPSLPKFLLPNR